MKSSRCKEEQIIAVPREREAEASTADVCRRHGAGSATIYKWTANYGGLATGAACLRTRLLKELLTGA